MCMRCRARSLVTVIRALYQVITRGFIAALPTWITILIKTGNIYIEQFGPINEEAGSVKVK